MNEMMGNMPSVTSPVVLDTLDSSASTLSTEKITSNEEEITEILILKRKRRPIQEIRLL